MYCTRWCPGCRRARAWFQANNIDYIEVDIDVTPGAADQVKKWANGTRTTPTFDIEGTILVGFDEKKVDGCHQGKDSQVSSLPGRIDPSGFIFIRKIGMAIEFVVSTLFPAHSAGTV